jgi:hypothetical protein
MAQLIGHPYEAVFELRDKKVMRVDDDPGFLDKAFEEVATSSGDNSRFADTNTGA